MTTPDERRVLAAGVTAPPSGDLAAAHADWHPGCSGRCEIMRFLVTVRPAPAPEHRCSESCLHDCPTCDHEVDHTATFHAPDCAANPAPEPAPAPETSGMREALGQWLVALMDRNMTPAEANLYDALRAALAAEAER